MGQENIIIPEEFQHFLVRFPISGDRAVFEKHRLIHMSQDFLHFMADKKDGRSLGFQGEQGGYDFLDRRPVQIRERFVHDEDVRFHRQDAGYGEFPRFSAGEGYGVLVQFSGKSQQGDKVGEPSLLFRFADTHILHAEPYVLFDSPGDDLRRSFLKDQTYMAHPFFTVHATPFDGDRPSRLRHESFDDFQQDALSRAVRACQQGDRSLLQGERDMVEEKVVFGEREGEVVDGKHGAHRRTVPRRRGEGQG